MTDVLKDFLVVIARPDGARVGSFTPNEFRVAFGCPTTSFIADCISRYNETQARQGYGDRAHLEMRTTRVTRRRVR